MKTTNNNLSLFLVLILALSFTSTTTLAQVQLNCSTFAQARYVAKWVSTSPFQLSSIDLQATTLNTWTYYACSPIITGLPSYADLNDYDLADFADFGDEDVNSIHSFLEMESDMEMEMEQALPPTPLNETIVTTALTFDALVTVQYQQNCTNVVFNAMRAYCKAHMWNSIAQQLYFPDFINATTGLKQDNKSKRVTYSSAATTFYSQIQSWFYNIYDC